MPPTLLALLAACADPCRPAWLDGQVDTVTAGPYTFTRSAVVGGLCAPAAVTAADLDGDGVQELVVGDHARPDGFEVPDGSVHLLDPGPDLASWTDQPLLGPEAGVKLPNAAAAADLDGDGDLDLAIGGGGLACQDNPWTAPCGSLWWIERDGGAWTPHPVEPVGEEVFFRRVLPLDVDEDGVLDLLAVGESAWGLFGSRDWGEARWYRGLGGGAFETVPTYLGEGLGGAILARDLDLDGDLDLLSAERFEDRPSSFVWLEKVRAPDAQDPQGNWTERVIDGSLGPADGLAATSLGGRERVWGTNHTGDPELPPPGVYAFVPPADPRSPDWTTRLLHDGFVPETEAGTPGSLAAADLDGDGDADLLVTGGGDPRVLLLEQVDVDTFTVHELEPDLPGACSPLLADLNGDGLPEAVLADPEGGAVLVYRLQGVRR